MTHPNFLLNMPKLPAVMAEDCNVPALRNLRNSEKIRRQTRVRRQNVSAETNEAFLRMLTRR